MGICGGGGRTEEQGLNHRDTENTEKNGRKREKPYLTPGPSPVPGEGRRAKISGK
jgi:hypothetical protein